MAPAGAGEGNMQPQRLVEEQLAGARQEQLVAARQGGAAADSSVAGVVAFALDGDGVVTAWGSEAERLFARSANDMIGQEIFAALSLTNSAEVRPTPHASLPG